MIHITSISLVITLLIYTLTSKRKIRALLISLSIVAVFAAYITNLFTTFLVWQNDRPMPASATLGLTFLVVVLFVYVLFSKKKKRALVIFFGVVTAWSFYALCNCEPSFKDIKVMQPMAKAISNYIVKHGIPKSLSEIPGVPYAIHRKKDNSGFYYFKASDNKYIVYQKARNMIEFQSNTKRGNGYTWLWLIYKIDRQGHYSLSRKEYFLAHGSGICSSMRQ